MGIIWSLVSRSNFQVASDVDLHRSRGAKATISLAWLHDGQDHITQIITILLAEAGIPSTASYQVSGISCKPKDIHCEAK